jgi:hypothetical protein
LDGYFQKKRGADLAATNSTPEPDILA